ncbi:efflux RND transporter periplasmic adaptor subunit, partial [Candidatus Sumerlaeota bacterium]|nr:efflux RND transporter periplasmic adaptor subunit [Candidatus Sumerlaeota bacterium]
MSNVWNRIVGAIAIRRGLTMKKIILLLVLAAMSGGGYYYWHNNHTKTSKDESRTRYVEIERDSIAEVVATTGGVDPNLEVEIKCRAGGQIIRLPYDVSDRVTSGSLLMELDPIDESRRVRQSE